MLRRRGLQKAVTGSKHSLDEDSITSSIFTLGKEYKDAREVLLEEEVLGCGENVIEALPKVCE